MARNCSKNRQLILRREKNLKGVASEQHEVEALAQPNAPGVVLNPPHPLASRPLFGQVEHGFGWIDTDD
jgi:hypothetical protein